VQNLFRGVIKKGSKKITKGKPFTLHHCWSELEFDEKWRNRDTHELPRRKSSLGDATIIDDDGNCTVAIYAVAHGEGVGGPRRWRVQ
jgi:hypothetical protein